MGFPMVYDMIIFNNEYPFLVTFELRTNFWAGFEVGEGGQIFLKRSLALSNYCVQYESICLSSLAKKVEQTDGRTAGNFYDSSSIEVENSKKNTRGVYFW